MKTRIHNRGILPVALFLLLFCGVAFAEETRAIAMQGLIDKVYVNKKTMRVNEELILTWDQSTVFRHADGSPAPIGEFKQDVWVYFEGVGAPQDNHMLIKKIYIIPKLIRKEEKHLYPFMK